MATKKEMDGARIRANLLQGYTRRGDALAYCMGNRHKKPLKSSWRKGTKTKGWRFSAPA